MKIRKLKAFSNLYIFMEVGGSFFYVGKIKEGQTVDFGPLDNRFVTVPFMNLYSFIHTHICCNIDGNIISTSADEEYELRLKNNYESEDLPF